MCLCIYIIFLIHSSISGHSGCFRILTTVNNAATTLMGEPSSVFILSGFMPRSGVAGSPGGPFVTILLSTAAAPSCMLPAVCTGPLVPTSQHIPVPARAVLTGMRWRLLVGLVCVSLMVSDVEPLGYLCLVWKNIYSYPLPT